MTREFEPFPVGTVSGRLCNQPGSSVAPLECALEGRSFAPGSPPQTRDVVVLSYNVERGIRWREQVAMLSADPDIPEPGIVLLSEVDRGCTRSGEANVALEYARELRMNYVYGVEFVELPRWWGPNGRIHSPCEHGNAILSKFPIGNVRLVRHARNRSWNSWWQRLFRIGEPRLGGRIALAADIDFGHSLLRVYSVHFESKGGDRFRPEQAREAGVDGVQAGGGVVIAGDMNFAHYREQLEQQGVTDTGAQVLLDLGYVDAHSAVPPGQRYTTRSDEIIDCIFVRGTEVVDSGVGRPERWDALSDHRPVWARLTVA